MPAKSHGMWGTPLYNSWANMRRRTLAGGAAQRNRPKYVGVKCDPRWRTFQGFLDNQPTTGAPWFKGAHLSRIQDAGDYSPENTRWLTAKENRAEQVIVGVKGRTASPETRAKMSAALKGHTTSEDTRRKISIANTGRKHTDETRAKMRANHGMSHR